MTSRIACHNATTIGPFLTLLVLMASRSQGSNGPGHPESRKGDAIVNLRREHFHGPWESAQTAGLGYPSATAIGPFLTLILTLHRRSPKGGDWKNTPVLLRVVPTPAAQTLQTTTLR
jgi:hypothetical protein